MNKFKFSALSVLRHKEWLEKEAQRILGVELSKLGIFRDTLAALEKERERFVKARQEAMEPDASVHLHYIEFDNKLRRDVNDQLKKISEQESVVRKKTEELNKAVRERKKLEKLREREYQEYRKISKRKETASMDEVSSNFYDRNPEST